MTPTHGHPYFNLLSQYAVKMQKSFLLLTVGALAAAQSPSDPPPPGCVTSYPGTFGISSLSVATKRDLPQVFSIQVYYSIGFMDADFICRDKLASHSPYPTASSRIKQATQATLHPPTSYNLTTHLRLVPFIHQAFLYVPMTHWRWVEAQSGIRA